MATALPVLQSPAQLDVATKHAQALSQLEMIQKMIEVQLQSLRKLRLEESHSDFIQDQKNSREGRLMTLRIHKRRSP